MGLPGALTVKTGLGDVTHRVLDSPDNAIHEQLELLLRDSEEGGEAVQVDSTEKLEEADTVFGELSEVLVDHVECRLEDSIQDRRYLRRQ